MDILEKAFNDGYEKGKKDAVRHEKWEPDEKASDGFVIVKCPSCGHSTYVNAHYVEYGSYCTYCGAYNGW